MKSHGHLILSCKAELRVSGSRYSRIDNLQCLRLYSTPFGNRSDLILVSSENILHCGLKGASLDVQGWMCEWSNTFNCRRLADNGYGNHTRQESAISNWNTADYLVDYCLVSYQPTEHLCKVVYSFRIMLGRRIYYLLKLKINGLPVVCLFNYLKCLCI